MAPDIKILFITLLVIGITVGCKEDKKVIETPAITFTKEGELQLYKQNSDSLVVAIDIEIADTDYEKETGLMYRDHMKENQGMLFVYDHMQLHSFYMKNTKIPLDLVFIDDKLQIASFYENAQPLNESSLSSQVPVQYILELNAGMAQKLLLEVGDRVVFTRK